MATPCFYCTACALAHLPCTYNIYLYAPATHALTPAATHPHPCCNAHLGMLQLRLRPGAHICTYAYMHISAGSGSGSGGCRPERKRGRSHIIARCYMRTAHACMIVPMKMRSRSHNTARCYWPALRAPRLEMTSRWRLEQWLTSRVGCARVTPPRPTQANLRLQSGRASARALCMYMCTSLRTRCMHLHITPGGPPRGRSAAHRTRPSRHPEGCRCSRCRRPGCRRQRS